MDITINVGINTLLIALIIFLLYNLKITEALFDAISVTVLYCTLQIILMLVINAFDETLVEDEAFLSVIMIGVTIMAMGIFVLTKVDKVCLWSQKNMKYSEMKQGGYS